MLLYRASAYFLITVYICIIKNRAFSNTVCGAGYFKRGINHTAKYSGMVFISYGLHIDMYIVNSVHFDECCQYALLKFEWILTQIPDKYYNDMSQPRSVGLRDPTRSVNFIYGMKYQIRNKRRSNFAWRKSFKIIFSLAILRDVSKFSTYYSICVFNLLNATYS